MRFLFILVGCLSWLSIFGQGSQFALRFYGTGVGPPGQQDRALFPVDDNQPGPMGNTPIDIGAGDFTIELWLRGLLADNDTPHNGGGVETFDFNWIYGNILLDRDIWCGSERKYGISLAGGLVRFGTAGGDLPPIDSSHTMEGNAQVLNGQWHHIALVRDASSGTKYIYVDGALDFASSPGVSTTDLSYPDEGVPVTPGQCSPGQLTPYGWYLVLAAEKHDAGPEFPSFNGYVDELRIWSIARSASEIAESFFLIVPPDTPGLLASYRFEEGMGAILSDSGQQNSPNGDLIAGTSGNGEWVAFADDPANTAPVMDPGACVTLSQLLMAVAQWDLSMDVRDLAALVNGRCPF